MTTSHLTLLQWIPALLAALCIGLSKSGLPGLGMVTVLLMAEILPARESTGAVLPLLICGDVLAVLVFQKHARWRLIGKVLPPALVGIVAGYFLMQRIPGQIFRPVIGWIVLLLSLLQFWRKRYPDTFQHIPHTRWFAWTMGGASGLTTMMANSAGPVMSLYLLAMSLPKLEFVGTAAWFFLIINLVKVPFSAHLGLINGSSLSLDLALAPAVAAGIWAGGRLIKVLPQELFETVTLLFAVAISLRFILG
jgi:uncharacterized membrane protein YfcA